MTLTIDQIDQLESEIRKRGVSEEELAGELLDHFCCSIEEKMQKGKAFDDAFNLAYLEICPDGLRQINWDEKIVQITYKRSVMKKFLFVLGFISVFIFVVGWTFKTMHWPGANVMILTGGSLFSLFFLPIYYYLKFQNERELGIAKAPINYVLNAVLLMVVCLTVPWKFLHWPFNFEIGMVATFLLLFGIIPKAFLNWYRNFGNQRPTTSA